jgi:hypothetical protein
LQSLLIQEDEESSLKEKEFNKRKDNAKKSARDAQVRTELNRLNYRFLNFD